MNLNQLRTRVRSLSGIRSTALLPDSEIDEYVNEFNYSVFEAYDWPQRTTTTTLTTVPGTGTYAMPSNAAVVVALEYGPDSTGYRRQLSAVGAAEFDALNTGSIGLPEVYYANPEARTVSLWPRPDIAESLRVRYLRKVTALASDNDAPPFDSDFHLMYAQAAAAAAIRAHGGDERRARDLDTRVVASIARLRKRYLMNPDRANTPMPRRWV
jgi:hypothetical protein